MIYVLCQTLRVWCHFVTSDCLLTLGGLQDQRLIFLWVYLPAIDLFISLSLSPSPFLLTLSYAAVLKRNLSTSLSQRET